ncbi:MAG: adenylate/guanylate cyclase domain-containing protein [Actinomycetota bacterium]
MADDSLLRWLTSVGLDQHLDALVAESVDLDVVPTLTDDDLRSLGFTLGDRRRFLQGAATAPSFLTDAPAEVDPAERDIERRTITVLFCDLVGSTALSAALDDESFARVVRDYSLACGKAIEAAGGQVAKYMGDGVMGTFGYPVATGDEAMRAIEAGFNIQKAVADVDARYEATVQARVGIASGAAIVGEVVDQGVDALGDTPNLAARVESKAAVGSVTVAPLTQRLAAQHFEFADAGHHELKGFDEPVPLHAAVRSVSRTAAFFDPDTDPVVGRERERAELDELRRSITDRSLVARIEGEPGIGKSSLLRSTISDARAEGWRVYVLGCSEHETATPFHPLRRFLESVAGTDLRSTEADIADAIDAVAERIDRPDIVPVAARLMGLDTEHDLSPTEARAEIFDLVLSLAGQAIVAAPTMIVVEDMQWCDPSSTELLDTVLTELGDAGLLLVVTERSGVSEVDDPIRADAVVRLDAFDQHRTKELVESLVGDAVADPVVTEIRQRSGGVPLYIAELTRALLDAGAIVAGADGLIADLDEVPHTLQGSLHARLDRLTNGRDVAPVAAAIGLDFSLSLLEASVPTGTPVDAAVRELQRAQLIVSDGDRASFRHALIRAVAYDRMLTERRQAVHGRIGQALIDDFGERAASEPQVVARHLALGPEPMTSVGWWYEAASTKAKVSANPEVLASVGAGLDVLAAEPESSARDEAELKLQLLRAGTLRATQGFAADSVETVYERAVELSESTGDLDAMSAALNGIYSFNLVRDRYARAGDVADRLLSTADALHDARRQVIANRAVGVVGFHTGAFATAEHHLEESIRLYHDGDYREDAWLIGTDHATTAGSFLAMNELVSGLGDAAATIDRAEALADEIDHFLSWAQVTTYRGFMGVIARDWPAARAAGDLLLDRLGERTIPLMTATGRFWSATGRFHQGDEAALSEMWAAADAWWATGARSYAGYVRSVIAEAEGVVGRPADGVATVAEAFPLIAENGERWALAECHRVAASLAATTGDHEAAADHRANAERVAIDQRAQLWTERLSR